MGRLQSCSSCLFHLCTCSDSWSWQTRLQCTISADLSVAMAGKAAGCSAALLDATSDKVLITPLHYYNRMASRTTEPLFILALTLMISRIPVALMIGCLNSIISSRHETELGDLRFHAGIGKPSIFDGIPRIWISRPASEAILCTSH